jgi:hypothetical protein
MIMDKRTSAPGQPIQGMQTPPPTPPGPILRVGDWTPQPPQPQQQPPRPPQQPPRPPPPPTPTQPTLEQLCDELSVVAEMAENNLRSIAGIADRIGGGGFVASAALGSADPVEECPYNYLDRFAGRIRWIRARLAYANDCADRVQSLLG